MLSLLYVDSHSKHTPDHTQFSYFTHTSGNPVLRMEIVELHRPNRTKTLNCESWGRGGLAIHVHCQMSIVNPGQDACASVNSECPLGLTIVNPGQDVHALSIVNPPSPRIPQKTNIHI